MKKLIFALMLLFSANAFSMNADSIRVETKCKAGYLFLITWSSQGYTVSAVQIFEKRSANSIARPQPMRCKK